ncbi:MAG: hypothetical protein WC054_00715 [Candidatus Nanopelagicales bacterium]
MGSSVSTHIFWGSDLGGIDGMAPDWEDRSPEWLLSGDTNLLEYDERLAQVAGIENPSYEQLRDLVRGAGCGIDWYGNLNGETKHFVYIAESLTTGEYSPEPLSPRDFFPVGTEHEWWHRLHAFMERLELPLLAEAPGWHMAAAFG